MNYEDALRNWRTLEKQRHFAGDFYWKPLILPAKEDDFKKYSIAIRSLDELSNKTAQSFSSDGQYKIYWLVEDNNSVLFEEQEFT